MTASQKPTKKLKSSKAMRTIKLQTGCKIYCVTIYNENLRKLNGDESLHIIRLIITIKFCTLHLTEVVQVTEFSHDFEWSL